MVQPAIGPSGPIRGRRIPAASAMASRLRNSTPPTQADPTTSRLPGNLIIDSATLLGVNTTGSPVGGIAPHCAAISYQNTNYYNIPWIGSTAPNGATVTILFQPPIIWILGRLSTT